MNSLLLTHCYKVPDKIQHCKVKYMKKRQCYLKIPLVWLWIRYCHSKKEIFVETVIKQINININLQCTPGSQVLCAILGSPSLKELKYRERPWFKVRMVFEGRTIDHSSSNGTCKDKQRLWQRSVDLQVRWGMEMWWLPTVPHHIGLENFQWNDQFKTKTKWASAYMT